MLCVVAVNSVFVNIYVCLQSFVVRRTCDDIMIFSFQMLTGYREKERQKFSNLYVNNLCEFLIVGTFAQFVRFLHCWYTTAAVNSGN